MVYIKEEMLTATATDGVTRIPMQFRLEDIKWHCAKNGWVHVF